MPGKITILVGTMSGTAELAADEISSTLEDNNIESRILRMEKASPMTLSEGGNFIICCSTYGEGDVPDNAQAFYKALLEERPNLSAMRFGLVAFGDSVYPNTFCFGGKKFAALLTELGASQVGTELLHDKRGAVYPEDAAIEWVEGWVTQL